MLRVPVINGPSIDPQSAPSTSPNLIRGTSGTGEAIRAVGNALGETISKVEQRFAKERGEAEAVIGADADLELDSRLEGLKSEHFKLKGLAASEARAKAAELAAKARQDVAAGIKSEAERNRFLTRSATAVMAARRQIETYTGREYDAHREGTLKAAEDSAVAKAASGVLDPDEFSLVEQQAIRTVRDTQRSEAEGAARVAELQSRMAAAYADGLLAQGRVQDAAAYIEKAKPTLGVRYAAAQQLVTKAGAAAEQDRRIAEGAKLVNGTYESLRMEANAAGDEYVDPAKLEAAINLDETGPDVRGEVEQALQRKLREETARRRDDTARERDNANRADLDRKPIPGATLEYLRRYDPDFLLAREARLRAEARAARAARSGDRSARAAEAAAQKAIDKEFLFRLRTELSDNPDTKPEDFLTAFIAEKAKDGEDVTVSNVARAQAGLKAAEERKKVERGDSATDRDASAFFRRAIDDATPKPKGKPKDQALLNVRLGRALELFDERTKAKGKPLDRTEMAGIAAEVVREAIRETPREILGIPLPSKQEKVMAIDLMEPSPSPAPVPSAPPARVRPTITLKDGSKAQLSADGKSWEPIK